MIRVLAVTMAALVTMTTMGLGLPVAMADSITTPDSTGDVGTFNSLVLDPSGNPIVSYYDSTSDDLMILHCDDPNCDGVGDTITRADTTGNVGWYTSLVLDASGNPIVSYFDWSNGDLKVLHCDDPTCDGTGETITSPDTTGVVGWHTSITLDSNGNPVIAYHDADGGDLKILHCDDPTCDGTGESITTPDTAVTTGWYTSIALDSSGHPIVAYFEFSTNDLKILHCDDPNCEGTGETITAADSADYVGGFASMELDASGHPVVAYYDLTNKDLKILHCDDPTCSGGGESITSPDAAGDVGLYSSLTLDDSGNPVVSYYDESNEALKILHCDDPNCAGGGESTTSPDVGITVGLTTSIALDGSGYPVVAYHDDGDDDLELLHCDDPDCDPPTCNGLLATVILAQGDSPTLGDDVIFGTPGPDTIDGLWGNDTICGEGGNDTIDAGLGDDIVYGGEGDDDLSGAGGDDTILGQAGNDDISGGTGADELSGNAGNDDISGDLGNDTIYAGSGNDTVKGNAGADTIGGSSGRDTIFGGSGADTISGGSGNDVLVNGDSGDDAVNGGGGNDPDVRGGADDDTVSGNGGNDTVLGGAGDDDVRGGPADDTVLGGDGDDFVAGNGGTDTCDGGTTGEIAGDTAAGNCETILNVP